MKFRVLAWSLLLAACAEIPDATVISLFDNRDPGDPKILSSSAPLPTGAVGPNCGCARSERSSYRDPIVPTIESSQSTWEANGGSGNPANAGWRLFEAFIGIIQDCCVTVSGRC